MQRAALAVDNPPLSEFIMQSTRSFPSTASERPCKRRCTAKKKKTVTFSSKVKLRSFASSPNNTLGYFSWLTADEISSIKKRARTLSMIHQIKTRPGKPAPPKRSGIVYNCHPAHYEIIGESLRGMEHHTDTSKARGRERLRSDVVRLVEEHQDLQEIENRSKLACMYKERTKEALVSSRKVAEEDARIAAAILAEDLKHDADAVPPSLTPSTLNSHQGLSCLDLLLQRKIYKPKVVCYPPPAQCC